MTDKTIEEQLGRAFDEHTDVDQDPADVVEEQVMKNQGLKARSRC